jgi:predicted anti-sigma-YlaC factor YlaD
MKTCDECQARLSAFLDGEAGAHEGAIRAHVTSCDACRKALDGLRRLSARIRDIDEAPSTLVEDIGRRIREEGRRRHRRNPVPTLAAAAAVLATLLWTAVLVGTARDDAIRVSDLVAAGGLSEAERGILYAQQPTDDELLGSILSGGGPR